MTRWGRGGCVVASPACRAPGGAVSPLGHDAPSRTRRGQSRPVVTEAAGRGAYAIRALPEEKAPAS